MVVYVCEADPIPNHAARQQIERQVARAAHEHIIIYTEPSHTNQVWQWVRREPNRPSVSRQHTFNRSQPGDSLIQKLEAISFELDEEEELTITAVAGRVRRAFDVDRVTRRFYDRFKSEHSAFLRFIKGIHSQGDREWYASLMLNRLMFVYFIQKKGFLDGDLNYLQNRLQITKSKHGDDKFHSFYRHFLLRLFHEGLGKVSRTSELDALLGRVPYLNGGLFDVHEIESANSSIEIPDEAFERTFAFFDAYSWHLDSRPLRSDNEINPDVLGYIFEKYINQRQMGAYYTKEDITEYISRSTIIPQLFDIVVRDTTLRLEGVRWIWELLQSDPDRYIYPAMRKGVDAVLPPDIAVGVNDFDRRTEWNKTADTEVALPTETWREYMERRGRCESLRSRLAAGHVHTAEDLVALNLNLPQFAQDIIENSEDPEILRAFYHALCSIKILDPTCGSGAFLFAALNILDPLYEMSLERMQAFLDEWARLEDTDQLARFNDFRQTLADVDAHPNRGYFILKSIILNNLYGVDIMEEAVEICKLRLFLKLAAQLEAPKDIEPLPDIDFNIRSGNALVGFASYGEVAAVIGAQLAFDDTMERVEERAKSADQAFRNFRDVQMRDDGSDEDPAKAKSELRGRLRDLSQELDTYLAREYGARNVAAWQSSHQPFHWFLNFYGILANGGFDAVIGNPPYVEYSTVRNEYTVRGFETLVCGDLYGLVMERGVALLREGGRLGMITPVSIIGTDGFAQLRSLLLKNASRTYVQGFAERPSKLFTGVEKRLAIWVMKHATEQERRVFSSKYRRWLSEEREHLFSTAAFTDIADVPSLVMTALPKVQSTIEVDILRKLKNGSRPLGTFTARTSKYIVYYTRKVRYFVQFFLKVPRLLDAHGQTVLPSELKELAFSSKAARDVAVAALNSSLWFWFFSAYSDVRNVNRREIDAFPINLTTAEREYGVEMSALAAELMGDFERNSTMTTINYAAYGSLTIQVFRPRLSKPVIDRIDRCLAGLYNFTDEEVDFIINHDIKYRLGETGAADEDAI